MKPAVSRKHHCMRQTELHKIRCWQLTCMMGHSYQAVGSDPACWVDEEEEEEAATRAWRRGRTSSASPGLSNNLEEVHLHLAQLATATRHAGELLIACDRPC